MSNTTIIFVIIFVILIAFILVIYQNKIKTGGRQSNDRNYGQVGFIVHKGTPADYGRLVTLAGKFFKGNTKDIPKMLHRSDFYQIVPTDRNQTDEVLQLRDKYKADQMYSLLKEYVKSGCDYLDFGCNRGGITYYLGQLLKSKNVYGTDILETSHPKINYKKSTDGKIPFNSKTVDLVTTSMVLHHIPDLDLAVSEIARVIKPGGIFTVIEHDIWTKADAALVDIEHKMYFVAGSDSGEYQIYNYLNSEQWVNKIEQFGFKLLKSDFTYSKKRKEITPTRSFWMIFKKL